MSQESDLAAKRTHLVNSVRDRELEEFDKGLLRYSDEEAKLATVHARHDLVLAIAYLDEISGLLRGIKKWLVLAVVLLALLAARMFQAI